MNPFVLGGIVKRVYPSFDLTRFDYRLKLQKLIYLFQESTDLNLGYRFNWYHFGPYCPELTNDAFSIVDWSKLTLVRFTDPSIETKFETFIENFKEYASDETKLEIIASLHFLKQIYPKATKTDLVNRVKTKRKELNDKQKLIEELFDVVERKEFIWKD